MYAYAIMSNHSQLVLYVNEEELAIYSESQVSERWSKLYSLPAMVSRWQKGGLTAGAETDIALFVKNVVRSLILFIYQGKRKIGQDFNRARIGK